LPSGAAEISARRRSRPEPSMSRYAVPLGFSLVAIWIAVLFVLINTTA
jgi:hypothetical protein